MDDIFSLIFFLWVAFTLFEGLGKKKKLPPPPSSNQDLDWQQQNEESATFEIPTLANDPNMAPQQPLPVEETVEIKQANNIEEIFRQRQALFRQRCSIQQSPELMQESEQTVKSNVKSQTQTDSTKINLNLTQSDVLNAMVLSEIFSKPKSLRR